MHGTNRHERDIVNFTSRIDMDNNPPHDTYITIQVNFLFIIQQK